MNFCTLRSSFTRIGSPPANLRDSTTPPKSKTLVTSISLPAHATRRVARCQQPKRYQLLLQKGASRHQLQPRSITIPHDQVDYSRHLRIQGRQGFPMSALFCTARALERRMCLFLMYFETHLTDFILWLFWRLSGPLKASEVRGSAKGSLGLFLLSLRLGLAGPWRLLCWTLSSSLRPGHFWAMTKFIQLNMNNNCT